MAIPQLLGDYILGNKVGAGAQASVVLAEHLPSKEFVALKVYSLSTPSEIKGFQNEAESLAKLQNCTGILSAKKSFQTEEKGVIVMEIMKNDLLDFVIDKRLTEKTTVHYFKQLCVAVKHMHDQDMAHLDIKPENCLLSGSVLKLCDFGNTISFRNGQFFKGRRGTRGYACPEMMDGEAFCPKQADMWSLGITLHIMLTGCFPFTEEGESKFCAKNLCSSFASQPGTSPLCINLLSHLLCAEPDLRYDIDQTLAHPFFNLYAKQSKPNTFTLVKQKLGRIVNRQ